MVLQNTDNNHKLSLCKAHTSHFRTTHKPLRWLKWQLNSLKCLKTSDVDQARNDKAKKNQELHLTWTQGGVDIVFRHGSINITTISQRSPGLTTSLVALRILMENFETVSICNSSFSQLIFEEQPEKVLCKQQSEMWRQGKVYQYFLILQVQLSHRNWTPPQMIILTSAQCNMSYKIICFVIIRLH